MGMKTIDFQRGFTLVDLLIVVSVLGIIATVAVPSFQSGLEKSKLSGAASEIFIALQHAQFSAMTTGGTTRVTIDDGTDTIVVERFQLTGDISGGGAEMSEADIETGGFVTMAHPVKRGEEYTIAFSDEDRFSGVNISSAAFGSDNYVIFDALGFPSAGGGAVVSYGALQHKLYVGPLGSITSSE